MKKSLLTVGVVLALGTLAFGAEPNAERFESLLQKVQSDPGGTQEKEVMELLGLAKELGRPYSASLSIRGYLSHNFRPSPQLLLSTAEVAHAAGDYTFAVSRYKSYLAAAGATKEASQAGAALLTILVDFLGAEEDAYEFLKGHGQKLRGDPAARRFDAWFLGQARSRSDHEGVAMLLSLAMAEKTPLLRERLYYWTHLDWLTRELATAPSPRQYAALTHCRTIVPLIREDKARQAKLGFLVENLAFQAGATGKGEQVLAREFEQIVAAARSYVTTAPTAKTLQQILGTLGGGSRLDGKVWSQQKDQKQELFVWAFDRLGNDADREAMLAWENGGRAKHLATPEQWVQLGTKHAKLFAASPATRFIPLSTDAASKQEYQKLAKVCGSAASADAAVIRALAAGGDLVDAIDYVMKNDATWRPAATWSTRSTT